MKKPLILLLIPVLCICAAFAVWKMTGKDSARPESAEVVTEQSNGKIPGEFPYNINIVDEKGIPVDGVMVNICTDESCTPAEAAGGFYGFDADAYPYVIHVIKVPQGYILDASTEYVMKAEGDTLTITVRHA